MFKAVFLLSAFLLVIELRSSNLVVSDIRDGKTLYDGKCATCHATDGKGNPKVAGLLKVDISKLNLVDDETTNKSDIELAKAIHDGTGKMKPFKDKLSDEEISVVVKRIRSLKK